MEFGKVIKMEDLFKVLRWPVTPKPLESTVYPGEVYELIDTSKDPFENARPLPLPRYTLLEVKQGWCRYRHNTSSGMFQDEREEINRFLRIRRKVEAR